MVSAEYKLPDDLTKDLEEDEEDKSQEKIEKYLEDIPKNGFIALSAAGEFALINRFERAINDLIDGNCYSQTLINWLFDVRKADLPHSAAEEISEWANNEIPKNENQKQAVEKALNAPELFLLQGPPGTGKTTVIAEIIFQLVKKGLRVLVSSQSNDAVDNALDRLSSVPEIRAIRLGKRGGKKKTKTDDEQCKYVEDEALKYYYKSLANFVSKKYLDEWENEQKIIDDTQKDLSNLKFITSDLAELLNEISKLNDEISGLNNKHVGLKNKLDKIHKKLEDAENDKRKFAKFKFFCTNLEPYDVLPEKFLEIIKKYTSAVMVKCKENGLALPENFMEAHSLITDKFNVIIKELNDAREANDSNSEIANLEQQIKKCRQEMAKAFEEDDTDTAHRKRQELEALKLKRDKLGKGTVNLDKTIFSENIIKMINDGKKDQVAKFLSVVQNKWKQIVEKIIEEISCSVDVNFSDELEKIKNEDKIIYAKLQSKRDDLKSKQKEYGAKNSRSNSLREKYKLAENLTEKDVQDFIENLRNKHIKLSENNKALQSALKNTMQKFVDKLNDEKNYKHDNEYFLDSYINSCNVVGISCTNNMKDLLDKGFDNFDVVIIDEVSKATPPELLIPLMKAGKVILVGDHRQLPPMFKEHEKTYSEMVNDLSEEENDLKEVLTDENFKKYKKMITASLFKSYFENADDSIKHALLTQYRMHSDIMDVINRFYDRRLKNGYSKKEENELKAHKLKILGIDNSSFIDKEKHVYWLDSSFLPSGTPINETFRENSTSATNVLEKYLIIELLKKIAEEYKRLGFSEEYKRLGFSKENKISVGVISFYQRQVNEIREAVKKAKNNNKYKSDFESLDIDVNTVDRFQGKEKNIIITSLVRNNKSAKASKHVVTFERINVAFSRAQNLLFIVAAEHMYRKLDITIPKMDADGEITLPVYANIIDELKRKGCFVKSRKLISADCEKEIIAEYKAAGGK